MDTKAQKVMAIGGLNPLQRRVLAALADGAQLLKAPGDLGFHAYAENINTGKVDRVTPALALADLKIMCALVPQMRLDRNVEWDYQFYYLPGAERDQAKELLTRSMPAPDMVQTQGKWRQAQGLARHEAVGDSDDEPSGDSVLHWAQSSQA